MTDREHWAQFAMEAIRLGKTREEAANLASYLVERMNRDVPKPPPPKPISPSVVNPNIYGSMLYD